MDARETIRVNGERKRETEKGERKREKRKGEGVASAGGETKTGPPIKPRLPFSVLRSYAVKLLPHPHPPVAFGLLNVNPEPCMELT